MMRRHPFLRCFSYFLFPQGRVHFAEASEGRTRGDVVNALNDAIDRRDEGIVLKDYDAVYKPNARAKGGWLKVRSKSLETSRSRGH